MKNFIAALAGLCIFLGACTPAIPSPVEQSQTALFPPFEESHSQEEALTSEYVPGSTPSASFEIFVSASELSGNGVRFTAIDLSDVRSLTGPFAYVSRKSEQDMTIYAMGVFTNHHVAEYEATEVEALNLFLIEGETSEAKNNMMLWCEAQGPQTQEEAQAGTNRVICFGSLDVE